LEKDVHAIERQTGEKTEVDKIQQPERKILRYFIKEMQKLWQNAWTHQ